METMIGSQSFGESAATTGWNVWVWEEPSWRVLSHHKTRAAARQTVVFSADPAETILVIKAGSDKEAYVKAHCTERMAPFNLSAKA